MNNKYSLRVFHSDGYYDNTSRHHHLQSDYDEPTRYDFFESSGNPLKEVVYWNRIYRMQNGRDPVLPQRIEKWQYGQFTVVKFNPYFFKITNWILKRLPTKIRRYRRNWRYVRFFGM